MMQPEQIEVLVKAKLHDADVTVVDSTGTLDHFNLKVVSPAFVGLSRLAQHRLVQACLKEALDDGRIHAVTIVTEAKA